jgi:hypothetical protein
MDPIAEEAFTGLATALGSLLPPPAAPALAPELTVNPVRIRPTGLGGYVGPHADPDGDVVGRFLEARALVEVKAASLDELDAAVGTITRALVGAGRDDLRKAGILRLELDELGAKSPPPQPADNATQAVTFAVAYEFLKVPDEGGGVIAEVPLDLELTGANEPRVLIASQFETDPLDEFEIVDDPLATTNAPSQWSYVAAEQRLEQGAAISGGTTAVNANKPGTYLVLRATPSRPPVQDLILRAELSSDSDEGVGLVFRYRDADNFCFFVMNQNKGYRLLAKKVAGSFSQIALDAANGFDVGRVYRAKVVARGEVVQLSLDGELVLEGEETALVGPGRVGFMTFRNPQARFYDIELTEV